MRWVRPIVTLIAVSGLTIGFIMGKIDPQAYILAVGVTITYWFKSRDEEKRNGQSVK